MLTRSSDTDGGSASTDELRGRVDIAGHLRRLEWPDLGQQRDRGAVLRGQGLALADDSAAQRPKVGFRAIEDLVRGKETRKRNV